MGCWDIFCVICGNPYHTWYDLNQMNYAITEQEFKVFYNKTKWLDNCTILTANNEIINNCE